MIRRLSRTNALPEKSMHEALRTAAKLHKSDSLGYPTVRFCPNEDTPSDVRAQYLREPQTFSISNREDILGWTRQASNATVLKMTQNLGVQALVLFERERAEAYSCMRSLAINRTGGEFEWLQKKLAAMPWSEKQLDTMVALMPTNVGNVWIEKLPLLDTLLNEMERYRRPPVEPRWVDALLETCALSDLALPFNNATMHKASLAKNWQRIMESSAAVQEWGIEQAVAGAKGWHARGPKQQDCLDLAMLFDGATMRVQTQAHSNIASLWQERAPIVLPWVSMLGTTPEEGQRAVDIYQQLDPDLLTFARIAVAMAGPSMDTFDNISELLCP